MIVKTNASNDALWKMIDTFQLWNLLRIWEEGDYTIIVCANNTDIRNMLHNLRHYGWQVDISDIQPGVHRYQSVTD